MPATLIQIIQHLRPGLTFRGLEDDYTTIQSSDGSPLPSLEQIEAARADAEEALSAAAAVAAVPAEVSMAQFRLALLAAGIDPGIIAQSLSADPAALIRWEYSTSVRRAHPLVAAMTDQLDKTSGQVDAIFVHAATL